MDYEQFKVYMKESVETVTGRKVTVHPLLHNNSLVRDSLSIDTPLGAPAGPAPVLWDYYQQYEKGASPGMLVNDVIRACEEAKNMVREFADFKHSKLLHEHIVHINTLEEEADQLFISSLRTLHTTCSDPLQIIVWREIYIYLEKCVDACEHVADTVESVVMKNS